MITKEQAEFLNRINSGSQKVSLGNLLLEMQEKIDEALKVIEDFRIRLDEMDEKK
jgi:hypothetical protein